jgi:hypothetical protein
MPHTTPHTTEKVRPDLLADTEETYPSPPAMPAPEDLLRENVGETSLSVTRHGTAGEILSVNVLTACGSLSVTIGPDGSVSTISSEWDAAYRAQRARSYATIRALEASDAEVSR